MCLTDGLPSFRRIARALRKSRIPQESDTEVIREKICQEREYLANMPRIYYWKHTNDRTRIHADIRGHDRAKGYAMMIAPQAMYPDATQMFQISRGLADI